jgi:hypothetical protein
MLGAPRECPYPAMVPFDGEMEVVCWLGGAWAPGPVAFRFLLRTQQHATNTIKAMRTTPPPAAPPATAPTLMVFLWLGTALVAVAVAVDGKDRVGERLVAVYFLWK